MKERRAWCTLKLFQRRHHCLWELVKILLDERGEGMVYPQIMVSGQVLSGRVWHACISYFHKYYANLGNLEMATAAIENVVLMGTNIFETTHGKFLLSLCLSVFLCQWWWWWCENSLPVAGMMMMVMIMICLPVAGSVISRETPPPPLLLPLVCIWGCCYTHTHWVLW